MNRVEDGAAQPGSARGDGKGKAGRDGTSTKRLKGTTVASEAKPISPAGYLALGTVGTCLLALVAIVLESRRRRSTS